uniref:Leucine rich pentatricopeptide repeat containing n=1 Tax=Zonotrichia albicollis TaxID=44394 RepID=A0A8D2M5X0_ZONAL
WFCRECQHSWLLGLPVHKMCSHYSVVGTPGAPVTAGSTNLGGLGQIRFLTLAPQEEGSVKEEAVAEVRTRRTWQFDWALNKVDNSVRKTGRIPKALLLKIFQDIRCPGSNHTLLLLQSCGAVLPEVLSSERTELAHMIWDKMKELGAVYDTSHYNALLKVYLQNEHKFSPTEFLARMEEANVQPNRVTYQRLIAAYCNEGDIEGASKILGFMKSKDLPITEAVFSSLLKGHARSGDMKSAENILSVMRMAGVEPGPDTYLSLLNVYAEKGDADSIKKTLEQVEKTEGYLMDRILMQVIFSLAKAGYPQHIEDIKGRIRFEKEIIPDVMNLCLTLITHGFEDISFSILKSLSHLSREDMDQGSFFLQHCVNRNLPMSKLKQFSKELKEAKMHSAPLPFILRCALEANRSALAIDVMKMMKEEGLPLRPHYCWPLLVAYQKENNLKGELSEKCSCGIIAYLVHKSYCYEIRQKCNKEMFHAELRSEALQGRLDKVLSICEYFSCCLLLFSVILVECFLLFFSTEAVGYFLYHLIDSMSDSEVQAKEERLRQYFHQLKKMVPFHFLLHNGVFTIDILSKKLEERKAENQPITDVLKQLIHALCEQENMQKALEVKAKYEPDMVVGGYAALINLCCRHDNVEEAMNLKEKVFPKNSPVALDSGKYVALIEVLERHGRLEDAINILTEMKEKDVPISGRTVASFLRILNAAATRGEVETVNRLHDTIANLGLVRTAALHAPLITVHLEKDDMPAALEALISCYKKYGKILQLHNICCKLVEKGDADLLQKVSDFISREYGDMMALYDLFFAFLQTGKYKEAKKVIETPGLRAHSGRLKWFAQKCILNKQMETLEQLVESTRNLFECDRDEMYYHLLQMYSNKDWGKAEAIWTKIQEENIVPREKTLILLADIFEKNGQVVPFEIPKVSGVISFFDPCSCSMTFPFGFFTLFLEAYNIFRRMQKDESHSRCCDILVKALLTQDCLEEALDVKRIAETHIKGFTLNSAASSLLIISQVRRDYLKDALAVLKGMLDSGVLPTRAAATALIQALAEKGDVKSLQVLENILGDVTKSIRLPDSLISNAIALAHTKSNDLDAAVKYLEPLLISGAQNPDQAVRSISYLLRKVSEEGLEPALEKFGAMAERVASQCGMYRPVTDLFLQYITAGRVDDARSLIQRWGGIVQEKRTLGLSSRCFSSKCLSSSRWLSMSENRWKEKQVTIEIFWVLFFSSELDGDVASVKATYEKAKAKNVELHEISLKSLATFLKKVGEPVPFTEPPLFMKLFKYYTQ